MSLSVYCSSQGSRKRAILLVLETRNNVILTNSISISHVSSTQGGVIQGFDLRAAKPGPTPRSPERRNHRP